MKTSSKVILGILVVAILWIFYVAYERANYEAQQNAPKPLPSKIVTPPLPKDNGFDNGKG